MTPSRPALSALALAALLPLFAASAASAAPLPPDDVLDRDLVALLARLGEPGPKVTPAARDRVKASLQRLLVRPTLPQTLERKAAVWPTISQELKARGLPAEFGYVAWAESGFRSDAASPGGSRGVWQFIPATARRYGLTVTEHVDERKDLAKETRAAAEYLTRLLGEFGKDAPLLALAAYNAGEHKLHGLQDALAAKAGGQKPEHRDFFWLLEQGGLSEETAGYVPHILAAALVGSHPERYAP